MFERRKVRTSQQPYHDRHPHEAERLGYTAAGILLVDEEFGDMLFIREVRHSKWGLNFIGGKRECVTDWCNLPRLETPFETACTEFEEETGEMLPTCGYESVYWFPQSKYLLFVVKGNISSTRGVKWLGRSELEVAILKGEFHEFTAALVWRLLDSPKDRSDLC